MRKDYSTNDFYSDIDKLIKLINISLDKGLTTNAQEYIDYFFQILVQYLDKTSKSSTPTPEPKRSTISISQKLNTTHFPERTIYNFHANDYMVEKLNELIQSNIRSGYFSTFHFILSRTRDAIKYLLFEKENQRHSSLLIQQMKFYLDLIYNKKNSLTTYEYNWYIPEILNWFTEIYFFRNLPLVSIKIFESETLYILRYFIDHNCEDHFVSFLDRLSSTFSYDLNDFDYTFKEKLNPEDYYKYYSTYNTLIEKHKFYTTPDEALLKIQSEIKLLESDTAYVKNETFLQFVRFIENKIKQDFQTNYILIILVKAIVYAIFREKYNFFFKYLNYSQPTDSDATWMNKRFDIHNETQLRYLIESRGDFIENDPFFFIRHHGFKKYFNTFCYYFLIEKFKKEKVIEIFKINNNYKTLESTVSYLSDIQRNNTASKLYPKENNQNKLDENDKKINSIISELSNYSEILKRLHTETSIVDVDKVEKIKKEVLAAHKKTEFVLPFLKYLPHLSKIEALENNTTLKNLSYNFYTDKESLLSDADISLEYWGEANGHHFSRIESNRFLKSLYEKAEKIKIPRNELSEIINSNKYNSIISSQRAYIKNDFKNTNYKETWAVNINNAPRKLIGLLNNKIPVFRNDNFEIEGYFFIDTSKIELIIPSENMFYESENILKINSNSDEKESKPVEAFSLNKPIVYSTSNVNALFITILE